MNKIFQHGTLELIMAGLYDVPLPFQSYLKMVILGLALPTV